MARKEQSAAMSPCKMLEPMQVRFDLMHGISSHVRFECNVGTLVGQCGCATGEASVQNGHHHPDRLLHEVYMRAVEPEQASRSDWPVCTTMRKRRCPP